LQTENDDRAQDFTDAAEGGLLMAALPHV